MYSLLTLYALGLPPAYVMNWLLLESALTKPGLIIFTALWPLTMVFYLGCAVVTTWRKYVGE